MSVDEFYKNNPSPTPIEIVDFVLNEREKRASNKLRAEAPKG